MVSNKLRVIFAALCLTLACCSGTTPHIDRTPAGVRMGLVGSIITHAPIPGPAGPAGPAGATGPTGPAGAGASAFDDTNVLSARAVIVQTAAAVCTGGQFSVDSTGAWLTHMNVGFAGTSQTAVLAVWDIAGGGPVQQQSVTLVAGVNLVTFSSPATLDPTKTYAYGLWVAGGAAYIHVPTLNGGLNFPFLTQLPAQIGHIMWQARNYYAGSFVAPVTTFAEVYPLVPNP